MAKIYKTTFKIRRGKEEVWIKNNPILAYGEPSFVVDKNYLKIGDGVTPWIELEQISGEFDLKMDKTDPVGTGSFSMNRKPDSEVGEYSHAEGYDTVALGPESHAEGYCTTAEGSKSHAEGSGSLAQGHHSHAEGAGTKALGQSSHAEGEHTEAKGYYSHAEGQSTHAIGEASHAEGFSVTAEGNYSHAEGDSCITLGEGSHAEGAGTKAFGKYSHVEGFATVAESKSQHVQGEFNIPDLSTPEERGKYAHIVGNGTSSTKRSNAHTIDWKGVGWFQGGLQVGGTEQDGEGAKRVLLEGDVAQADWNQNDSTKPDFIKNRTHYDETEILFSETTTFQTVDGTIENFQLEENKRYRVTIFDSVFDLIAKKIERLDNEALWLGNVGIATEEADDNTGEPFLIWYADNTATACIIRIDSSVITDGPVTTNIRIETVTGIKKLDTKYYDRVAYNDTKIILSETLPFSYEDSVGYYAPLNMESDTVLTKCQIKIDEEYYKLAATILQDDEVKVYCFGNLGLIGWGAITGEPFVLLVAPSEKAAMLMAEDGIQHKLEISIPDIKQIDLELVPGGVADYAQNKEYGAGYIKNKPFYNEIIDYNISEVLANGAKVYTGDQVKYIKLCDYIPFGDWVYDIAATRFDGTKETILSRYIAVKTEYGWEAYELDITLLRAFKEKTTIGTVTIEEPGIYYFVSGTFFLITNITIPFVKKINEDFVSINWNSITEKPFEENEAKKITKITYSISDEDLNISGNKYKTELGSGNDPNQKSYERYSVGHLKPEEIIGATITLSDNSSFVVTDEMLIKIGDGSTFWEIENLLISCDDTAFYTYENGEDTFRSRFIGLHWCVSSNPYVISIQLPERIKKIDEKFLPTPVIKDGTKTEGYLTGSVAGLPAQMFVIDVSKPNLGYFGLNPSLYLYVRIKDGDTILNSQHGCHGYASFINVRLINTDEVIFYVTYPDGTNTRFNYSIINNEYTYVVNAYTASYIDSILSQKITAPAAEVGQTIAVKTIDENGKPTEWEAVYPIQIITWGDDD